MSFIAVNIKKPSLQQFILKVFCKQNNDNKSKRRSGL